MMKIFIKTCPICRRIKKYGIWSIPTAEDKYILTINAHRIVELPQVCPQHFFPTKEEVAALQQAFL